MAIWDSLLKRLVAPVVNQEIKRINDDNVGSNITKIFTTNTSQWSKQPTDGKQEVAQRELIRGIKYRTLREFSIYYPILRACINYRKRLISQLQWDITPREVVADKTKKEAYQKDAETVKKTLTHPSGDKTSTFREFMAKILEDILVLDAVAIYRRQSRGGKLYGYLPIDSTTIELALNPDGTTPLPPNPAYVQKIDGQEVAQLTIDELIYKMMNPRTNSPYGLSPVESLIITITTALKLGSYNLSYLTDGNVPEGFVELPKDVASDPDQLRVWQEAWDAMFAGDSRLQRKIKFLPEGMEWHPTKKQEDMTFERFEKWLLLNTCAMMEVPPQAIGFQFDRGKGATEAEWEIGKERGLFPTANFLKEIMDMMVQEDMGFEHLEFVWTNINPTNKLEESKVFDTLVRTGAVSVDEWRLGEGLTPIGLPHYIMTPTGPIFVKDFLEASDKGIMPNINTQLGQPHAGSDNPAVTNTSGKPNPTTNPKSSKPVDNPEKKKTVSQKILKMARAEITEELKRWKRAAVNDYKLGRGYRLFNTELIDYRTQELIRQGLGAVNKREDLDQLFDPFINQENQILSAVLDLYDDINLIAQDDATTNQN